MMEEKYKQDSTGIARRGTTNERQNGFLLFDCLTVMKNTPFRLSEETPDKVKRVGASFARLAKWPLVRRTMIVVVISCLLFINLPRALAQDKGPTPGLLDKSLEDLMLIAIDSVYGASRFTQKVTEAPASI